MRLDFDRIYFQNFKSFTGEHDFMLDDYGTGLHFLRGRNRDEKRLGSNGAGKSSIWDALCWCLYGRTPDGSRNPDIEPWFGDKQTQVNVLFRVDDKEHEIVRATHPNALQYGDEPIGQEEVERLVGMSLPVFLNTVLLGQGQHLFYDLTPRDKMSLFSDVLDLERWETRSYLTGKHVASLETELATWSGELTGLEGQQAQLDELLTTAKERADEWERDRSKHLKNLQKQLKQVDKEATACDREHGKANLIYDGAVAELRQLQKDVDKASQAIRATTLIYDRADQQYNALERERDGTMLLIKDLKTSATCPTCGQRIRSKADLREHVEELQGTIARLNKEMTVADPKRHKGAVTKAETNLRNLTDGAAPIQKKANDAQDVIDATQGRLATLTAQQGSLRTLIKGWEEGTNPHAQQARELRKQKSGVTADHRVLSSNIEKRHRRIERTKYWVKGFKDVRLYVIDDVLQELELTTNAMLVDVGLIDWEVKYSVYKETKAGTIQQGLNTMIMSPKHRKPVRWESWSGGEGQRLRLVGALALSEVLLGNAGVEPSLEILDEPTQHLSREGVTDLCDYLADRARHQNKQIWYVDHNVTESNRFASIVTVTKDSKGSRIEP